MSDEDYSRGIVPLSMLDQIALAALPGVIAAWPDDLRQQHVSTAYDYAHEVLRLRGTENAK